MLFQPERIGKEAVLPPTSEDRGYPHRTSHEYLGVGITLVFAVHLALHWRWVVKVSKLIIRRLFSIPGLSFKYLLNVVVLLDLAFAIVTGLLISNTLGLYLPLDGPTYETLRYL